MTRNWWRVLGWELRKIFVPFRTLLALGVGALYAAAIPWSFVEYFPQQHPHWESHQHAVLLVEEHGPYFTERSRAAVEELLAARIAQADRILAADAQAQRLGIANYAEYVRLRNSDAIEEELSSEVSQLGSRLLFGEDDGRLGFAIQDLQNLLAFGDSAPAQFDTERLGADPGYSDAALQRIGEAYDSGEYLAVQSGYLQFTVGLYVEQVAIVIVVLVLLLTSPLVTLDQESRLRGIQYVSRTGRALLSVQALAQLLAALAIGLVVTALAALPWLERIRPFWSAPATSFLGETVYWLPISYGGQLALTAALLLLLAGATGVLGFILSRWSTTTIGLIVRLLLLGIPSAYLAWSAFHDILSVRSRASQLTGIPLAEVWLLLTVTLALLAVAGGGPQTYGLWSFGSRPNDHKPYLWPGQARWAAPRSGGWWKVSPKARSEAPTRSR